MDTSLALVASVGMKALECDFTKNYGPILLGPSRRSFLDFGGDRQAYS